MLSKLLIDQQDAIAIPDVDLIGLLKKFIEDGGRPSKNAATLNRMGFVEPADRYNFKLTPVGEIVSNGFMIGMDLHFPDDFHSASLAGNKFRVTDIIEQVVDVDGEEVVAERHGVEWIVPIKRATKIGVIELKKFKDVTDSVSGVQVREEQPGLYLMYRDFDHPGIQKYSGPLLYFKKY